MSNLLRTRHDPCDRNVDQRFIDRLRGWKPRGLNPLVRTDQSLEHRRHDPKRPIGALASCNASWWRTLRDQDGERRDHGIDRLCSAAQHHAADGRGGFECSDCNANGNRCGNCGRSKWQFGHSLGKQYLRDYDATDNRRCRCYHACRTTNGTKCLSNAGRPERKCRQRLWDERSRNNDGRIDDNRHGPNFVANG